MLKDLLIRLSTSFLFTTSFCRMELVSENGFIVSIPSGCKRKLGRGSELAISDKTVSRNQVLMELKEQRKKFSPVNQDSSLYGLSIEVLGANPVCILHNGQSRGDGKEVVFCKKGEKDTMFVGDQISLSLSHPQFFTFQEAHGKKNVSSPAQDDLLQKWEDRKIVQVVGPSVHHATSHSDALSNRCLSNDTDIAANEEEGIAQAVARRRKRALERQQRQAQNLQDEQEKVAGDVSDVQEEAHEQDGFTNTQNIDPEKEFGFLVEGSEFDQYISRGKSNGGRWIWPPLAPNAESSSDDDVGDRQTRKHDRKAKQEEEWRGDDQQEEVAVACAKERKLGFKLNLRSKEPSTSKIRNMSINLAKKPGSRMVKNQREELEEAEDEADETLGGFIVDDEDDPIDDADDADDEEEELSENDDVDEDEDEVEVGDLQQAPKQSTKKRGEKPLCKYGKTCYRKNPDHLKQFRHQ